MIINCMKKFFPINININIEYTSNAVCPTLQNTPWLQDATATKKRRQEQRRSRGPAATASLAVAKGGLGRSDGGGTGPRHQDWLFFLDHIAMLNNQMVMANNHVKPC